MFVTFLSRDILSINVAMLMENQAYQNCMVSMNSVAVPYKTTLYLEKKENSKNKIQIQLKDFTDLIIQSLLRLMDTRRLIIF